MRKGLSLITSLLTLSLVTACQSTGLYVANLPHQSSDGHHLIQDIAYGQQPWQKLDIYQPVLKDNISGKTPVIMFLYGGGWSSGSKEGYLFTGDRLAREGFTVVIPDYRKYPQALYPSYQQDAAQATAWLIEHIGEYGGDVENLHLMGHSAGAHIGAMLLADKQFLAAHELKPSVYRSFAGLAGPYHFTPSSDKYRRIFSNLSEYRQMQADFFIDGSEPPMLLLHGKQDTVVDEQNSKILAEAILKKGGDVSVILYEKIEHLKIIGAFSFAFQIEEPIVQDIIAFFKKHS